MKDTPLRKRLQYWFDRQMSKGTFHLLILLGTAIAVFVLITALLISALHLSEGTFGESLWDLFASTVNAWMPYTDDGETGFVLLSAIAALIGLLFTSVLIGVVSNAIEEKITSLRRGKTMILAENHFVLLGFESGQYELINQLILAANGEKRTIVVCDEMERDEMEDDIRKNVEIPKNIEILCRNVNIEDPSDLACAVPEKARAVLVNVMADNYAVKATLAVLRYLNQFEGNKTEVISSVSTSRYLLPEKMLEEEDCTMVRTNDFIAKVIAHTTSEPGLSHAYIEFLRFEGQELYVEKDPKTVGLSVLQLHACLDKAVLLGLLREGRTILNPKRSEIIRESDELILLEEHKGAYKIDEMHLKNIDERPLGHIRESHRGSIVIFGYNYKMKTLISELPEDASSVTLVNDYSARKEKLEELKRSFPNIHFYEKERTYHDMKKLEQIVRSMDHVIIISNDEADSDEQDDIDNTLLMLRLIEIRKNLNLHFNITTELRLESSYNIALSEEPTDFVIASNIISMVLAQLSENPKLYAIFRELLSNTGNELFCKPLSLFNVEASDYSVAGLKQIVLSYGYTLLGYQKDGEIVLNPPLSERVELSGSSTLIVIGTR